jgi:hypothetical protein
VERQRAESTRITIFNLRLNYGPKKNLYSHERSTGFSASTLTSPLPEGSEAVGYAP